VKVEERPRAPAPEPELAAAGSWTWRLRDLALRLLVPVAGLLAAAVIGALVVLVVRGRWSDVTGVARAAWGYGLFGPGAAASILRHATPLVFAGLATAAAFKAGLFNIGVEGQYAIGALCAGWVGSRLSAPAAIHLPLAILAGMAGGLLWALLPALLKAYRGVHEVISTVLMNYLAGAVLLSLLSGPLAGQQTRPTARVGGTALLALAVAAAVGYAAVVRRTRFGFELRVLGIDPRAAVPAGVRSHAMILGAMLLSGAVAGLAGLQDVLAGDGRLTLDDARGYGFTAIAVAVVGRGSGLGVVAAALLFSFLDRAGAGIGLRTHVPAEVVPILQGVSILTVVVADQVVRRLAAGRRLREPHEHA
jgi:ABC-type uncharacterized transport system permease subunit